MRSSGSPNSARLFTIITFAVATCCARASTETDALVDRARELPIEFRADVLFRLIDSGRVNDPKSEREILESLFAAASQAEYPTPFWDAGTRTDTRSWAVASGLHFGVDTLSIRCRVVQRMLARHPTRARELFLQIEPPAPADPACEDALVPNVNVFYETGRELMERSFSLSERNRGDAEKFFEPYVRSMAASQQLPAAAKAIASVQVSAEQKRKLIDVFASRLAEVADADRAFSFGMQQLGLANEILQLASGARKLGLAVDGLLSAYRAFLVRHLTAERCSDSSTQAAREYVAAFNERLRLSGYLASTDLSEIKYDDSVPTRGGGKLKLAEYWQTPAARGLLTAIKHLRFGDSTEPLAAEQKQTVEWQNEVRQFLGTLAAWNAQDEATPADYFHQRAILYAGLIDLLPKGELRESVVQSAIAFLSQNPIEKESPAQFLSHLNALLDQARTLPGGASILAAMRNSRDPVISLYASLDLAPLP